MKFRDKYSFLSNMYYTDIPYEGLVYPSVENAYQASKCVNEVDKIPFQTYTPVEAKKAGKKVQMKENFNDNRIKIMQELIDIKFINNINLAEKLVSINEPIVEENTWNDTFWGVCNGIGDNNLGKCLENTKQRLMYKKHFLNFDKIDKLLDENEYLSLKGKIVKIDITKQKPNKENITITKQKTNIPVQKSYTTKDFIEHAKTNKIYKNILNYLKNTPNEQLKKYIVDKENELENNNFEL